MEMYMRSQSESTCKRVNSDLPWIRNALLVAHAPVTSAITTLFLFQMAMLVASISAYFEKMVLERKRREKLTFEAQLVVKLWQGPSKQSPASGEQEGAECCYPRSVERGAHKFDVDPDLGIA
jgi:hypothetical protein